MPFGASEENNARSRLVRLRDFLATLPEERFDMRDWNQTDECGSVCCIGGWTEHLFAGPGELSEEAVAELIGLDYLEGQTLFYPANYDRAWDATPAQAVRVLDHLLATGEVCWEVAFTDQPETVTS